ncbi:sushi, von Willebrand factor type A, EGF and pentraxin domain-containing protein 1, partial [Nephila pilipes]
KKFIRCQSNTKWSPSPQCEIRFCPIPKLSKVLKFQENCSSKIIGEKCSVKCRNPLEKLIGEDFIKCQENGRWNRSPQCKMLFCPELKLNSVLKLQGNCSTKGIGEKCQVKCREGGSRMGPNYVTCKINATNLYWTSFPKCTCLDPVLPRDQKKSQNCLKKMPGEICNLKCSNKRSDIVGKKFIRCQSNTKWSPSPQCEIRFCPNPKLSKVLKLQENCSSKIIGEKCSVKCRNPLEKVIGEDFIKCQENGVWSPWTGECEYKFCPRPVLKFIYSVHSNCSYPSDGEKCELRCREGGNFIGPNYITCKRVGRRMLWGTFPICTCPNPVLPKDLKTTEDCSRKKFKDTCSLSCSTKNLTLVGNNLLRCQQSTKWSPLPQCKMRVCPNPKLNRVLKLQENCSSKIIGEKCFVKCRSPLEKLIGEDFIKCQENGVWSPWTGECEYKFCPRPVLKFIYSVHSNCSYPSDGEKCELRCREGGNFIGPNYITCKRVGRRMLWGTYPICTCPNPVLPKDLKTTEDCSRKKFKDTCSLSCSTKNLTLVGNNLLRCQQSTKWSPLPQCKMRVCPNPKLNRVLKLQENCSSKVIGDKCFVSCKESLILVGKDYIICQDNGRWSHSPQCKMLHCPTPKLNPHLRLQEKNCSSKAIGEKCLIECNNPFKMIGGIDFITCQENGVWSPLPERCV